MTARAAEERLYLDDVAIGMEFRSGEYRIDAEQISTFATEYDPQPFHLSETAAAGTFFGGLAASGWHTAAITMKLLVRSVPFGRGLIGAGGEISWPRATRPGDVLHVTSRITEIRPSRSHPDRATVTLESLTCNSDDDVVQKFVGKVLVFKRPSA